MALIIKIIEETLSAGTTTLTVTDAAIPYSIIAVNCDKYGTYPANMTVSGTTLTLAYEAQTEDLHLAISLIKADLAVIDDLTSDSQTDALSAAQGKALKALIDNIVVTGTLSGLDDVDLTELTTGDILVYDAVSEKWVNASQPAIPSDITDLSDVNITSIQDGQILVWDDDSDKFVNRTPASAKLIKYQATMSSNPYGWFTFVDENGSTLSPANGTPVFASCFDGSHYYSGIFVQADANTYVFKVGDINISPLALSTTQLSNLTFDLAYVKAGE